MRSGDLQVAVEVPSGFGRDLKNARAPEFSVWIDGSMPFRGETAKSYVIGLVTQYAQDLTAQRASKIRAATGVNLQTRFRYNQSFKSVNAMVPSVIMLMLMLIPAIMATIGVVREKETGSIANFYSTPITKFEFLFGKQLPYIAVAMARALPSVDSRGFLIRSPGQRIAIGARAWHVPLCAGLYGFRPTCFHFHAYAGRGGFRHDRHRNYPGRELLWPAGSSIVDPGGLYVQRGRSTVATVASTEVKDLTVGIVDEDNSDLSRRLPNALNPPLFKPAVPIPASEIDANMDNERLIFVLEIPPRFEMGSVGRPPNFPPA